MRRTWAVVGVAAFVALDVVLIGLAVRHSVAAPASQTVTITRTAMVAASTPGTTVSSVRSHRSTPSTSAGDPTSTVPTSTVPTRTVPPAAPSSSAPSPTAPSPTRPSSVSSSVAGSDAAASTGAASAAGQRVLLDLSSDGAAIRATAGDCTSSTAATVEVSEDGGVSWRQVAGDVRRVLRVIARQQGEVWFVGAGPGAGAGPQTGAGTGDCVAARYDAPGFTPATVDGVWYLPTDPAGTVLSSPAGPVDTGCVPIALAAADTRTAHVLCSNGALRITQDTGASWRTVSRVPGAVAISFQDVASGYLLAATKDCPAAVLATDDRGVSWTRRGCLKGTEPQAVAAAGDQLLAVVDGRLQGSADAGRTWTATG